MSTTFAAQDAFHAPSSSVESARAAWEASHPAFDERRLVAEHGVSAALALLAFERARPRRMVAVLGMFACALGVLRMAEHSWLDAIAPALGAVVCIPWLVVTGRRLALARSALAELRVLSAADARAAS